MKAFPEEYYRKAIEYWKSEQDKNAESKHSDQPADSKLPKGKITVNGKNVDQEYMIKDGDHIVHET